MRPGLTCVAGNANLHLLEVCIQPLRFLADVQQFSLPLPAPHACRDSVMLRRRTAATKRWDAWPYCTELTFSRPWPLCASQCAW